MSSDKTPPSSDPYSTIALFYDEIMGLRSDIPLISKLLEKHAPRASSLLELACGKATVLAPLSRSFTRVTGLDISEPMLERARYALPHINFVHGDMRSFELDEKFDVVLCVFDSINHLTSFGDWKAVFECAANHLNSGGLFLFDINTDYRFISYEEDSPFVDYIDKHICIFDVEAERKGRFVLDIQFFEHQEGSQYTRHHASIAERTFEEEKIEKALSRHFDSIKAVDERGKKVRSTSESIYFICRKSS
jgi:SAM-dependent methyltransferase